MQSLVEDVNAAVMAYRRIGTSALEQSDPEKAVFAVDGMVQLLMDDFALSYSDFVTLDSLERERRAVECSDCGVPVFLDEVKISHRSANSGYRFMMPPRVTVGKALYVKCPAKDCGKETEFRESECFAVRDKTRIKYIPHPPSVDNILSQTYSGPRFWKWFRSVWSLVEARHRLQRESIKQKEDEI